MDEFLNVILISKNFLQIGLYWLHIKRFSIHQDIIMQCTQTEFCCWKHTFC